MTWRASFLLRNLLALAPALVLTATAVGFEGRNNARVTADYLSKQAQLASTSLGIHFERLLALTTFCATAPSITLDWDPSRFATSCGRAAKMLDAWVVVVELGPMHRQVINTRDDAPETLPVYPRDTEYPTLIDLEDRSRISGKPGLADAIVGKVFKGPVVTAGQWVRLHDGRPAMVYAGLAGESLSNLLREYGSPTNTVFELYDGSRRIIARSEDSDRFVFVSAAPWAQQAMDIATPGVRFNVDGPAEIGGTWNVGYRPVETAPGWMVVALEPADRNRLSWSFVSGYGGLVAFGLFLSGAMFWYNANRSRLEAEIRYSELARSISEAASRDKSEFLASFAHDVRTPLVSLIGSVSLLESGGSDRSEVIANIDRSAQGLLHLVDDILELSFLGSGRFDLQMSPVDLRRLTLDIQAQMQLLAFSKDLAFNINIDDSVPLSVEIDRMRIQQVLTNLVSNAIKYTEKGSVSLAVSATPRAGGKTALRFSVADTGVGIRPEDLSELGREFGRLDRAIEGKEHGTGLGLAICKRILKAMGTKLEIESVYGRGSTFSFSLIARVLPDASIGEDPKPLAGIRILYVEDEPVIRQVTTQQLTSAGAEVVSVADGQNALDEVMKQEPQLLLIDLQMPRMDGVQTIRALKAMLPDHRFPIFILTSHIAGPQTAKAREAGADVVLTKPIQIMPLAAAFRARGGESKGVAPNISPTLPKPADGLIDLDNFLVHLRVDPDAMLEVHVPDFESRMRKDLAQLSADIRASRHAEAEKLAHRCLGLCLVYGAVGLATQLKSVERAAAAGNFGALSSQNEDLLDLLERTTTRMRELGREWIKTA